MLISDSIKQVRFIIYKCIIIGNYLVLSYCRTNVTLHLFLQILFYISRNLYCFCGVSIAIIKVFILCLDSCIKNKIQHLVPSSTRTKLRAQLVIRSSGCLIGDLSSKNTGIQLHPDTLETDSNAVVIKARQMMMMMFYYITSYVG